MAFSDEELFAAWQAGQTPAIASEPSAFSNQDLFAAWQAGQQQSEPEEPSFFDNATRALTHGATNYLFGPALDMAATAFSGGQPISAMLTNKLLGKEAVKPFLPGSALQELAQERVPQVETADPVAKYGYAALESAPAALLGPVSATGTLGAILAGPGGELAKELGGPEWVGQVSAGVLPALGSVPLIAAQKAYRALSPNIAGQADDAVRAALGAAGTDAQKIAAALETAKPITDPNLMRVAEITNDPGLALLTKSLEINSPQAKVIGQAKDAARAEKQLLTVLSKQGPVRSAEASGNILREGLQEGLDASTKKVRAAYNSLSGIEGTIPTATAKRALFDFIQEEGAENISPAALAKVERFFKKKVNITVDEFVELQKQFASAAGAYGKAVKAGSAGANAPEVAAGYRLMSRAANVLDDAMEKAIGKNRVPKSSADKIAAAKALKKEQAMLFQRNAVGDVLQKTFGDYDVLNSQVVGKVIQTPEEARQVFRALKQKHIGGESLASAPRAQQTLRSALIEDLKTRSTSATTGEFMPTSFSRSWRNMKAVAKEVLAPEQIQAIESVRRDMLSRLKLDRLARSASGAGSQTAELLGTGGHILNALSGKAVSGIARRVPVLGEVVDAISKSRSAKVQALAERMLIDIAFEPKFAKAFAQKPTVQSVELVFSEMLKRGLLKSGLVAAGGSDKKKAMTDKAESPKLPAQNIDLDRLVNAVIGQESGDNPRAIGYETPETRRQGARALGLMQIMPDTAKDIARELGVGDYDLFDPETNKTFGRYYLAKMLQQFNNDLELALTAYHSGPATVARLLKQTGGNSLADIVDLLGPAGRKYAKGVLSRYGV